MESHCSQGVTQSSSIYYATQYMQVISNKIHVAFLSTHEQEVRNRSQEADFAAKLKQRLPGLNQYQRYSFPEGSIFP